MRFFSIAIWVSLAMAWMTKNYGSDRSDPDQGMWISCASETKTHQLRDLICPLHWSSGKHQPSQVIAEGVLLDQYSLTIGFARRFATYKRANLILSDYERLLKIITREDMPVQLIFAGKAHPADEPGKLLIQQVYRAAKDPRSTGVSSSWKITS